MHRVCHFCLFLTHASGISNNSQNIKTYPVSGTIPGGRNYLVYTLSLFIFNFSSIWTSEPISQDTEWTFPQLLLYDFF